MNKKSIAMIVGIICVAITLFSTISTMNADFYKIPIFEMVLGESEVDQMARSVEKYADNIKDATDEEIEELEEETGLKFKKVLKMAENPSLSRVASIASKLGDDFIDDEGADIIKTANTVIIVYGAVIMLISLLAALLSKKGLTILALIISLPFYIFLVGTLGLILFVVASIAHVVFLKKEKNAPIEA